MDYGKQNYALPWKMKSYNVKVLIVCMLGILVGCQGKEDTSRVDTLPYYNDAMFTPVWLESESEELKNFHKIPAFDLVNQNGETVTQNTFADTFYVADFIFTSCPGICPQMTENMTVLQETFKTDPEVMLLSHSVTPKLDAVPVLKSYAEIKGVIDSKWHIVTGDRKQIYNLGRNYYFAEQDLGLTKEADDFLHTENFVLIDKNKHIRGIYNGLNTQAIEQLIADIKTLKLEKT